MDIEAKPKLTEAWINRQAQLIVSAYTIGKDSRTDEAKWLEFLKNAERVFLEDAQHIAEIAFNKGREYERRNPKDKP